LNILVAGGTVPKHLASDFDKMIGVETLQALQRGGNLLFI